MPLFFRARPPLSTVQRVQIALLMRRTVNLVGVDLPRECEIVPRWQDLGMDPVSSDHMLNAIKSEIIARFPPVSESPKISVANQIDGDLPSIYRPPNDETTAMIEIHRDTLADPLRTIVEIANQYATHAWHLSNRLPPHQIHPNLTHLMPVCCGLVILVSNSSFYDVAWSTGGWQGWAMSRAGYYNASEIGYAAALLARHRNEMSPGWFEAMRLDSRHTADQAMKYFVTSDRSRRSLLFDAKTIPAVDSNPADLANWLAGNDPEFALAAGYALSKAELTSPAITAAAISACRSKQRELMPTALELLSRARPASDEVCNLVTKAIRHSDAKISIAALHAAHTLGISIEPFRNVIQRHLRNFAEGSIELIDVISNQGSEFESLDRLVCQHLAEAVLYSHDPAIQAWTRCLKIISSDPATAIEKSIGDAETRERLMALIESQ